MLWPHKEITLKVSLQDLHDAGLLEGGILWKYLLSNLNPQIYWNGKGILELDYVEFEDTMNKRQKTDTELIQAVRKRFMTLQKDMITLNISILPMSQPKVNSVLISVSIKIFLKI
jgi:hypothetical protein